MASSSTSSPTNVSPIHNWFDLTTNPQTPPLNTKEGIARIIYRINRDWIISLNLSGQGIGDDYALRLATKLRANRMLISRFFWHHDYSTSTRCAYCRQFLK